jgi:hypothetical protein
LNEKDTIISLHDRFEWLISETATDDWDTRGSPAIPRATWELAEALLAGEANQKFTGFGEAFPSPGGGGGVNLRWSDDTGCVVDAEVFLNGPLMWASRVSGGKWVYAFGTVDDLVGTLRDVLGR